MTRSDSILIAAIAVVALVAWPLAAGAAAGGSDQVSISGPAGTTTCSLQEPQRLVVAGARGDVVVVVADRTVRVAEADCPDHICQRSGTISKAGSIIACVPNGVVVRVVGGDDDGLDARVR